MNKADVTKLFKKIKFRYPSFTIPCAADDVREMVEEWLIDLKDIPLEVALANLRDYAKQPEHKFAPHPGVLAVMPSMRDRYSELMKELGQDSVLTVEQMQEKAVPISEDQRRKVRELIEKGTTV